MKLEEIVTVKTGRNQSRLNDNPPLVVYSYEDLINDLDGLHMDFKGDHFINGDSNLSDSYATNEGDVVFSFVSSKAGIVSKQNQGKIINQNFARLIIDTEQLNRQYLCYALNESQSIKKQMAISMQGSTLPKLTPAILKELELTLPSIKKQQVIGQAYFIIRKQQALAKQQAALEEQLVLGILKKLEQN
ncbi:restriction endonuclease subunit S [Cytobacillus sp. FSL R5-0569]|uniref:restriction endonuclease subunit S n=1 Tax=Cytobacillus sp. FSL R5-0569 TaxID=2921649 RepID=UPI0030F5C5EA